MLKSIGINLMILGVVLTATVAAQAAEPRCTSQSTFADCQGQVAQDQAILKQGLAGQIPTFLDVAKNADGSPKLMTQQAAIEYCQDSKNVKQPAHLPGARELAQLSMSLGAKGIVHSCGSDSKCYSVSAKNADSSSDSFNFSYAGYPRPAGDLGNNWFWSSSVDARSSAYPVVFVLDGINGLVDNVVSPIYELAVRCVSSR